MTVRRLPWPELLILLVALVFRIVALDLKPPHFDEGVNGWFADRMAHTGFYDYDPTNYHGPLHFYAIFAAQKLFGREIWALRLPVVLVSVAAVWLMLRFGRFVGRDIARWAAVAMAVSPAGVFYGRYSIHESWLLFFLLLTAWGILELWRRGSRAGLFALIGGATGMVLTKETYFIHLGCFALAIPCLWFWQSLVPSRPALAVAPREWKKRDLLLAAGLGIFAIVFFYSGGFLNWAGLTGLYETYAAWFKTGVSEAGHAKTEYDLGPVNYYWLALMARYEWPALIGLLGCFRLLWPASAQLRYLAIYGGGALLAYTIIPYKTPWLLLPLLWPFLFVFGAVVEELKRFAIVPFLAAACIGATLMLSANLNFRAYDDPRQPYVYVQTSRQIHRLIDPLFERAKKDPTTYQLRGELFLDSYYPLPWILAEFVNVSYSKTPGDAGTPDFIVAEQSKVERVERFLREPYYRREFRLRDAQEDCVAWFRVSTFKEQLAGENTVTPQPGER